jgi:hypothetical protein
LRLYHLRFACSSVRREKAGQRSALARDEGRYGGGPP